jgi:peptidoglycan/xylan/chitin deacetylase (PgdA/CDA1 family)
MRTVILDFLKIIARFIPQSWLPAMVRRNVFSVFYHAVSDGPMDHVRHLYPIVPVSQFEAALAYMQENFSFVRYQELHDQVLNQGEPHQKIVHLSFDDGFRECFSVVRPILVEKNIPCTFFITTDWVDNQMLYYRHQVSVCVQKSTELPDDELSVFLQQINDRCEQNFQTQKEFATWITSFRQPEDELFSEISQLLGVDPEVFLQTYRPYLTTEQIRQMHAEGFTIGAHSLSHKKLISASDENIETEIVESCQRVREITGQEIVPFSFPQSAWGVDRKLLAAIRKRHPFVGLLFDTKDLRVAVPFMINRIWAERAITRDRRLHSLPEVFTHAYRDAWVDGVMRALRR